MKAGKCFTRRAAALIVISLTLARQAQADNGTWTNLASGGLWSDANNWTNGISADGSGFTADFSTLDVTADNTVHLDSPRTLTALKFGDTVTNSAAGWTLDNNGSAANILTLEGTTPTITVNALGTGKSATVSAEIAGTNGLVKAGAGLLTLLNTNSYSGGTTVSAGTLMVNATHAVGTGTLTLNGGTLYNTSAGCLLTNSISLANATQTINVGAGGELTLNGLLSSAGKDSQLTLNGPGVLSLNTAIGSAIGTSTTSTDSINSWNGLTINITGYLTTYSKTVIRSGTVYFSGTNTWCANANNYVGIGDGNAAAVNVTAGSLTVKPGLALFIGSISSGYGMLNISGGTVTNATDKPIHIGAGYDGARSGSYGLLTVSGGSFVDAGGTSASTLRLGPNTGSNAGSGTVNFDGGLFSTARSFVKGTSTAAYATNNFNGGTLQARANNATFMTGLTVANVRNGGAVIDDGGYAITIGQALLHSTIAGDNAKDGGLTKRGAGTLTLTGTSTYNGLTKVEQGELIGTTGGSCANSILAVSAGATNGVKILSAGGQWACAGLTNDTATGAVAFDFGSVGLSPSTAPLQVNGSLALSSSLGVIVRGTAALSIGQYPLIKYTGTLSGTPPALPVSLPPGVTGSLSNNTANSSIDLVVTVPSYVYWAAGSGNWDINTSLNWKYTSASGVPESYYVDGQSVTFDDSTSGSSPFFVTNTATVSPASVTINNLKSYTISGKPMAGPMSLTKTGSGSLTLTGTNTYSGGTTMGAGTLFVNGSHVLGTGLFTLNGGTLSNTVSGCVLTNNMLLGNSGQAIKVGPGGSLALNGLVSSAGNNSTLTVSGPGTLTLNTASGSTVGTSGSPSGTMPFSVNGGATVYIGGYLDSTRKTVIANGTVHFSGTNVWNTLAQDYVGIGDGFAATVNVTAGSLTLKPGVALFIGSLSSGYGMLNISGGTVTNATDKPIHIGAGYDGVRSGSYGLLTVSGGSFVDAGGTSTSTLRLGPNNGSNAGSGTINLNGGTFSTARSFTKGTGSAAYATNNFNGGTLQARTNNATFMTGLTVANVRNGGAVIDDGGYEITIGQALVHSTITGDSTTDGGLVKKGVGMLTLTGTNTYNGPTTVNEGMLTIGGTGKLGGGLYAGAITNNGVFNYSSASAQTNSGVISGSGSLVKSGNGTLTLSGANTYNGATTVSNGTLLVTGDSSGAASAMNVASNAFLGGNGSVGGSITLTNGAALRVDLALADKTLACGGQLSFFGLDISNCVFSFSSVRPPVTRVALIQASSLGTATFANAKCMLGGMDAKLFVEGNNLMLSITPPGTLIRIF